MFSDIFLVISPAFRLAVSNVGLAACKALLAASPAFFCTAGLRAAVIKAVMIMRRNSILCAPFQSDHKLWLCSGFFYISMLQPDIN